MNIADRIQHLRKIKGVSQEELADKMGVSRQAVSKWESEQSIPEIDKIIAMSDYFAVTTDYLLKGIEVTENKDNSGEVIVSQILYITSTLLIVIGLLCVFTNWHEYQTTNAIGGSMIIQAVGIFFYLLAKTLSKAKSPFYVKFLNVSLVLWIPISMVTGFLSITIFKQGWISPYPIDIAHLLLFACIYLCSCGMTFIVLRRRAD